MALPALASLGFQCWLHLLQMSSRWQLCIYTCVMLLLLLWFIASGFPPLLFGIYFKVRCTLHLDNLWLIPWPGKCYNQLCNRSDKWFYEMDHLVLGTIFFTLVTFLMPTILIYQVFFSAVDNLLCLFLSALNCICIFLT